MDVNTGSASWMSSSSCSSPPVVPQAPVSLPALPDPGPAASPVRERAKERPPPRRATESKWSAICWLVTASQVSAAAWALARYRSWWLVMGFTPWAAEVKESMSCPSRSSPRSSPWSTVVFSDTCCRLWFLTTRTRGSRS